jgi:coproporphyrinogen III oxidase-like Fe-S oxidoreductase
MAEYVFLALRTAAGVSWPDFAARFGCDFTNATAQP